MAAASFLSGWLWRHPVLFVSADLEVLFQELLELLHGSRLLLVRLFLSGYTIAPVHKIVKYYDYYIYYIQNI